MSIRDLDIKFPDMLRDHDKRQAEWEFLNIHIVLRQATGAVLSHELYSAFCDVVHARVRCRFTIRTNPGGNGESRFVDTRVRQVGLRYDNRTLLSWCHIIQRGMMEVAVDEAVEAEILFKYSAWDDRVEPGLNELMPISSRWAAHLIVHPRT